MIFTGTWIICHAYAAFDTYAQASSLMIAHTIRIIKQVFENLAAHTHASRRSTSSSQPENANDPEIYY